MDSATATALGGFGVMMVGFAGAIIKGRSDNRTLAVQVELNRATIAQKDSELKAKSKADENTIATELRQELREHNESLRNELRECNAEIAALRLEVQQLRVEVIANQDGRKKAEKECERLQTKNELIEEELRKAEIALNNALRAAELPEVAARAVERERERAATSNISIPPSTL